MNFTVTILTTTTRLFSIFAVNVNGFCKCFFVCYLRSTNVSFYFEFTKQTVNDDFQMQLTHTSDDGLTSFLIGVCTEGRILLSQFCKGLAQFALACFCLRLDSQLDNRLRELHGLEDNRMLLIIRAHRSKQEPIKAQVYKLFRAKATLRVENTTEDTVELIYEITQKLLRRAEQTTPDIPGSIYSLGSIDYVNLVMQNDEVSN